MARSFDSNCEAVAGQLENLLNSELPFKVERIIDLVQMGNGVVTIAKQAATLQATLRRYGYTFDPNFTDRGRLQ